MLTPRQLRRSRWATAWVGGALAVFGLAGLLWGVGATDEVSVWVAKMLASAAAVWLAWILVDLFLTGWRAAHARRGRAATVARVRPGAVDPGTRWRAP